MKVPQQLADRYRIGEEIGLGGMSEIYLAVDTRLNREVAIKILRPELASDNIFYLRFKREAENSSGLSHPNIAQVYDTGEIITETHKIPYIVMEFVDGETLREILNREKIIDPATSLQWAASVADALDYSHKKGIIHRDMKPANIMIGHTGSIKVVDFGIARAITDVSRDLTQTATVIGTARYLSPEQATGKSVDARSDLYALGCVLFELLTGRPPFTAETPVAVVYQHVKEQPALPSSLNPHLTTEIDSVVLKALSKNPRNRYQSALEFREDLIAVLNGEAPQAPLVLSDAEDYDFNTEKFVHSPAPSGNSPDHHPVPKKNKNNLAIKIIGSLAIISILAGVAIVTSYYVMGPLRDDKKLHSGSHTLIVPTNLLGLNESEASIHLNDLGFNINRTTTSNCKAEDYNHIMGSTPLPGSVSEDHNIDITVCQPAPKTTTSVVIMPNIINKSEAEATKILDNLHISNLKIKENTDFDEKIEKGNVISTTPAAGTQLDTKAPSIVITLSKGEKPKVIPEMIGQQLGPTEAALEKLGLEVSVREVPSLLPEKQIIDSSASAGAEVESISSVVLTVSSGSTKMPNLEKLTVQQAQAKLNNLGYQGTIKPVKGVGLMNLFHPKGTIVKQTPEKDTKVKWNSHIQVWVRLD